MDVIAHFRGVGSSTCAPSPRRLALVATLTGTLLMVGCTRTPPPPVSAALVGEKPVVYKLAPNTQTPGADGASAPAPLAATPVSVGTPRYQVIAERLTDRRDGMSSFYVTIDPVDLKSESFKTAVKQVLIALAAINGGPQFSAYIWDSLKAAQTELSHESNPDIFTEDLLRAKETLNNTHWIASYVGGLSSAAEPPSYVLMWFPTAGPYSSPEAAQLVSAETWKP